MKLFSLFWGVLSKEGNEYFVNPAVLALKDSEPVTVPRKMRGVVNDETSKKIVGDDVGGDPVAERCFYCGSN